MSTTGRQLRFRALRRSVRRSGLEFWRTAGAQSLSTRIGAVGRFCLCEIRVLNIHTRPTYTGVSQWDFRGPGLPVLVTRRYGFLAFLRKNTTPCWDCSANTSRRGFRREMPYACVNVQKGISRMFYFSNRTTHRSDDLSTRENPRRCLRVYDGAFMTIGQRCGVALLRPFAID